MIRKYCSNCIYAIILAFGGVDRSEPSTHWVRSYRKRTNQELLIPERPKMLYEQLQHNLDKTNFRANRELKNKPWKEPWP